MAPTELKTGELLAAALRCCRGAAELARRLGNGPLTVWSKGIGGDVADADLALERFLRAQLRAAVPGSAVVGEEEELTAQPKRALTWYVDPIDGTGNFLRGLPIAAISVDAAVGGRLIAGCVLDLFRDECFTGGVGVPTTARAIRPQPVSQAGSLPLVLTDIPLAGRVRPGELGFLGELLVRAEVRRVYSTSLSLAWVAAGRADIACNLGIRSWDVAAGAALVRAAGGTYTPIGTARADDGDAADLTAPGFVATTSTSTGTPLVSWITDQLTTLARDARA